MARDQRKENSMKVKSGSWILKFRCTLQDEITDSDEDSRKTVFKHRKTHNLLAVIYVPQINQNKQKYKQNLRWVKLVSFDQRSFMYVVQFSSVAQSCLTLCDPMNRSMPGLPVQWVLNYFLKDSCESIKKTKQNKTENHSFQHLSQSDLMKHKKGGISLKCLMVCRIIL